MKIGFGLAVVALFATALAGGCDSGGFDAESDDEDIAEDEDVGEAEEAIVLDSTCNGASLWVYDTVDRVGGHRVCFSEPGTIDLNSVCRTTVMRCDMNFRCSRVCNSWWGGNVKSYWPGSNSGTLRVPQTDVDQGPGIGCEEWFNSMNVQGFTVAGSCARSATELTLDHVIY